MHILKFINRLCFTYYNMSVFYRYFHSNFGLPYWPAKSKHGPCACHEGVWGSVCGDPLSQAILLTAKYFRSSSHWTVITSPPHQQAIYPVLYLWSPCSSTCPVKNANSHPKIFTLVAQMPDSLEMFCWCATSHFAT